MQSFKLVKLRKREPFISNMSRLPSPPAIPSDYLILLTYTPGQTKAQRTRENEQKARAWGLDTECVTGCDELEG